MSFVNETGTIGVIYNAINQNITGSAFLTLLCIIALVMLFFMAFHLPLEATAILVLPMLLTFMAFEESLFTLGGVFLIYMGVLLAKNWLI